MDYQLDKETALEAIEKFRHSPEAFEIFGLPWAWTPLHVALHELVIEAFEGYGFSHEHAEILATSVRDDHHYWGRAAG